MKQFCNGEKGRINERIGREKKKKDCRCVRIWDFLEEEKGIGNYDLASGVGSHLEGIVRVR